jgi:hypothetical protein
MLLESHLCRSFNKSWLNNAKCKHFGRIDPLATYCTARLYYLYSFRISPGRTWARPRGAFFPRFFFIVCHIASGGCEVSEFNLRTGSWCRGDLLVKEACFSRILNFVCAEMHFRLIMVLLAVLSWSTNFKCIETRGEWMKILVFLMRSTASRNAEICFLFARLYLILLYNSKGCGLW